ncbi:D-alanyl-D-alanine carboxypeptidase/D-alanyl-D-alanine-endopeptidase [Thiosulfativibrio zosterae]|uniref:Serine-type D-Ala-D-Ala carboxypeptidase n=1 Tax=Thiosulfativibrio zosterae TaxID=2675053 RepID=A0A6F8PM62_9GAMM|nr:D-alanyl-D-alanine carboxypeptidase [Thiosulfativibrio zosterae]BBP43158.1 serine-type D-Ala-D-Ala carboxypeptidase [Thiosulfativibrio zosterae]
MQRLAAWSLLLSVSFANVWAADLSFLEERFTASDQTGLLLTAANGQVLAAKDAQQLRTPASTTKLLTAYLALQHWGADYRFQTRFYLHQLPNQTTYLVVQGFGDPFLTSEELQTVAKSLAQRLQTLQLSQLAGIQLDTSYYVANPSLPGTFKSQNPYDAIPSAITANFNTVNVIKNQGQVRSAEAQTPLTLTALALAQALDSSPKAQRMNSGELRETGEQNFAELLAIFLAQQGIAVGKEVVWQKVDALDTLMVTHHNSKTLAEMIAPMMRYSTNFIANQLALNLSAEAFGPPASPEKVAKFYQQQLQALGWQEALIEDGAGLSANNRLSPQQLVELLGLFEPYRDLLPEIEPRIFAKSGSLIGVSTLAGYIQKDQDYWPFALMMNEKMPYHYRNLVAKQLRDSLNP